MGAGKYDDERENYMKHTVCSVQCHMGDRLSIYKTKVLIIEKLANGGGSIHFQSF